MPTHKKPESERFKGPAKYAEYLLARAVVSLLLRLPIRPYQPFCLTGDYPDGHLYCHEYCIDCRAESSFTSHHSLGGSWRALFGHPAKQAGGAASAVP